jgi:hypothetical protein
VNSFLHIRGKFGRNRILETYSNQHLSKMHYGTHDMPYNWRNESTLYELSDWGLIGDMDQKDEKVYYLELRHPPSEVKSSNTRLENVLDRPVDEFERYAIEQLKKGEMLVRWERPEFLRYVGAIRATTSCISCHTETKEGAVLGAFTYDFNKVKAQDDFYDADLIKAAREGKSLSDILKMKHESLNDYEKIFMAFRLSDAGVVIPEMISMQKNLREHYEVESLQSERLKAAPK